MVFETICATMRATMLKRAVCRVLRVRACTHDLAKIADSSSRMGMYHDPPTCISRSSTVLVPICTSNGIETRLGMEGHRSPGSINSSYTSDCREGHRMTGRGHDMAGMAGMAGMAVSKMD